MIWGYPYDSGNLHIRGSKRCEFALETPMASPRHRAQQERGRDGATALALADGGDAVPEAAGGAPVP